MSAEDVTLSGVGNYGATETTAPREDVAETNVDDDAYAASIEVTKIQNNRRVRKNLASYRLLTSSMQFGFKKWKSRVTKRPLETRSTIVKELYSDPKVVKAPRSTR